MADINVKANVQRTSTLGKVRILVEQVVGSPSQAQISQGVADYIDSHPGALSPLSQATKSAMLDIAEHVAYNDANGQSYYNALSAALNAKALLSITAVYTQSGTVYDTDSLDSLKSDLVVTAYYDDATSADVTSASTLSGTLAEGTCTITVTYGGKTATFDVTVSAPLYALPTAGPTQLTASGYSSTLSISDDVVSMSGNYRDVMYVTESGTVQSSRGTSTWFTVPSGTHVVYRVYDITWSNPSSAAISLDVKWARSDATGNVMTASFNMPAGGSGTGGEAVFEAASYSTTRTLSSFCAQFTQSATELTGATVSFRVELTVDGVKYF